MSEDRPIERLRARRGLGARGGEGETTPANRKGRLKNLGNPGAGRGRSSGRSATSPRAEHARRRTLRDNPEGVE
jgi:hypothetical protein